MCHSSLDRPMSGGREGGRESTIDTTVGSREIILKAVANGPCEL